MEGLSAKYVTLCKHEKKKKNRTSLLADFKTSNWLKLPNIEQFKEIPSKR